MQHYPLITVVGGSGFVGRHVVRLLAKSGYRVRVITRDVIAAEFLKTQATIGDIGLEYGDITRPETLRGKFAGSDGVVNLVGVLYESGRQSFGNVHVAGARAVAEEAARAGVPALVHVSALGAERARDTQYGSTKLAGEQAVRTGFPTATILRPSLIAGPEDGFFQRFARMAMVAQFLPVIGGGQTKFQPVLVTDVALAVLDSLRRGEARGQTYELTGPKTWSLEGLLRLIARVTNRNPRFIPIPVALAKLQGFFCELLPFAPMLTRDQVKMLRHDNIASPSARGFADLGIQPGDVEEALPALLSRYVKAA